jgi:hypothetical protein
MTDAPSGKEPQGVPWHQSVPFLIGAIVVLGPLALPLVWANRKFPLLLKAGITLVLVGLTLLLLRVSSDLITRFQSDMEELRRVLGP